MDDDNYVHVPHLLKDLEKYDPDVPLLLAGEIGPKHGNVWKCRDLNNATHWSCCNNDENEMTKIQLQPPPSVTAAAVRIRIISGW